MIKLETAIKSDQKFNSVHVLKRLQTRQSLLPLSSSRCERGHSGASSSGERSLFGAECTRRNQQRRTAARRRRQRIGATATHRSRSSSTHRGAPERRRRNGRHRSNRRRRRLWRLPHEPLGADLYQMMVVAGGAGTRCGRGRRRQRSARCRRIVRFRRRGGGGDRWRLSVRGDCDSVAHCPCQH